MKKYLSIILLILGISNLIFAIGIITNIFYPFGNIYAVNSILTIIAVIGISKYKKWGVYLYLLTTLIALINYIYTKVIFLDYICLLINLALIHPVKNIWKEFK